MPMITSKIRRGLTGVAAALTVATVTLIPRGALADQVPAAPRPNIVLIVTDDQDWLLGSVDAMPFLTSLLVNQGMTFANCYTPSPLCGPSRASLLTGRYPHSHQVYTNLPPSGGYQALRDHGLEGFTVATALQAGGYRTALIGKYINGYPLADNPTYVPPGWDEWVSPTTESAYGGFGYQLNENGHLVDYEARADNYLTDVLAAKAMNFITRAATLNPAAPFFLALSVYAPHEPALSAPRHRTLFASLRAPRPPSFNELDVSDKPPHVRQQPLLTEQEIEAIDELYRDRLRSLQAVDELIARLVRTLSRTRQLDHTYIIFTSDNGFHLGQHRFRPGKNRPYEEDLRVPLIVRGPDVPAGVTRFELASLVDLAPTIADLAGVSLPMEADGRSLLPLLFSTAPVSAWRKALLAEHYPTSGQAQLAEFGLDNAGVSAPAQLRREDQVYPDFVVVRTAEYKYIERGNYAVELYDLADDPYELRNRSSIAAAELLTQLSGWAAALNMCAGQGCWTAEAQPPPVLALRFRSYLPLADQGK